MCQCWFCVGLKRSLLLNRCSLFPQNCYTAHGLARILTLGFGFVYCKRTLAFCLCVAIAQAILLCCVPPLYYGPTAVLRPVVTVGGTNGGKTKERNGSG